MSKWQFFELDKNDEVIPFKSTFEKLEAEDALSVAMESKVPNPKFSGYYVNCACILVSKKDGSFTLTEKIYRVSGGNLEYGLCQALHGEESLVSALSSRMDTSAIDRNKYRVIVAFSSKFETGRVPTCCGNCRDIMRDYFPSETMIFGGHPRGGRVIVARLKNLLFNDYKVLNKVDSGFLNYTERQIAKCLNLENNIYFPGVPEPGRRYIAIIKGEKTYFGAHDVMCDYHPIYAVRDAVRQARRDNNPHFSYVVVASQGVVPDVMYKDRQHLLELNFQQECVTGKTSDPLVYLMTYEVESGNPKIKTIRATNVKKWLPYAFSPANFGNEFIEHAKTEFKKLH